MLVMRHLGLTPYEQTLVSMREYTHQRSEHSNDEVWFTEHNPVFTQGLNGKEEHILSRTDIPVIQTDRGGQVTYHGPGQLIAYFLVNLVKNNIGVRQCVNKIEQIIITFLNSHNVDAYSKKEAPGVYVKDEKIAALGLKIRKGCSYHGFSLNNDMDLSPFNLINPCGYKGLGITQLKNVNIAIQQEQLIQALIPIIQQEFSHES